MEFIIVVLGIVIAIFIFKYRKKDIKIDIKEENKEYINNEEELKKLTIEEEKRYSEIKNNYEENKLEIEEMKYLFRRSVLNRNELNFYNQLKEYLKDKDVFLFSKVRLVDFLNLDRIYNYKKRNIIFNKVKSKHVDFIITDTKSNILYLIELDWNSHLKDEKTIENDKFKNTLFEKLNLKLVRYNNNSYYNFSELKI